MKKEEFKKYLEEYVDKNWVYRNPDDNTWHINFEKDFIISKVEIGGTSGGSCWDTSDPRDYTCYVKNTREFFDFFMHKLCQEFRPDVPFIIYNDFVNKNITNEEFTEREYYGNKTSYCVYKLNYDNLFEFLFVK